MAEGGVRLPAEQGGGVERPTSLEPGLIAKAPPLDSGKDLAGILVRFQPSRSLLASVIVAVLAVAAAVLIRATFFGGLGTRLAYLTFYPCVAIAAIVGGARAGALATVLAALVTSVWVAPLVEPADWMGLATFLASCALITGVTEAMHLARGRAARAEGQAGLLAAIHDSEARLRLFVDHAPAAMAMFDRDMRYLVASGRWRADFGLCDRDLNGLSHYEVFPETPERWREIHRRALAGETLRAYEDRFERADGQVQWIRWEVLPWRDAAGAIAGIVIFSEDISERKKAEKALQEREEFVRGVLNSLPQEVAVLDDEGVIVAVNEAWERFAKENDGEPNAVAAGANYLDICRAVADAGDRDARRALEGLQALRTGTGAGFTLEYPCHAPDRSRWFMMHATRGFPRPNLIVCHTDITKQKQAEEALRDSEQKLRAIFEAATDAIVTIDEKGVIRSANPAAARMFGYEAKELIGRNVSMLMPEPDRSRYDGYLQNYLRTGEATIIGRGRETEALRKDGTLLPVELAVGEMKDGGPRMFVGIVRDITERRLASTRQQALMEELSLSEAQAREQQALFRSVFDSAPEGIVLTDMQGRVIMGNPALQRMFGFGPEALVGTSGSKLFADFTEWERFHAASVGLDAGSKVVGPETVGCTRRDGEVFPAEIIKAPYLNSVGDRLGSLSIIRDVTWELKQEEELRQAQRLEGLGQLTGGIAHDFNNLLTVISGNLQILEMKLRDERLGRHLAEAERAVEMGVRLTQRLTTFARQRCLEPALVNLSDQVTNLLELLHRSLGEHVTIKTSLAGNLWPTLVDPSEIENAILNLAINARDAMPNGGKLIIETENVLIDEGQPEAREGLPPDAYVRLSVSDTGSGMTPGVLAHAFEPFFTTKGPGKGTGLGLASIYGFVKQSGGHVTLYSEVERGTTVNMYLPKAETGAEVEATPVTPATPVVGGGETVLVVEDNPDVRRVTAERLEILGYKVLEAEDAHGALAKLDAGEPIDLVFSDVVMPGGMSGFELAHRIRELWPSQRLLLTSGFTGEVAQAGERPIHGPHVLRKPYGQAELARSIRAALTG